MLPHASLPLCSTSSAAVAGVVALAKALHRTSHSSIRGAAVYVFVAGNDTSHAEHLTPFNIRVAQISEAFHLLAPLNSSLHAEITDLWYISIAYFSLTLQPFTIFVVSDALLPGI